MKLYIKSATAISPQKSFDGAFSVDEPELYTTNRLRCVEPDYKQIIDPKLIRRMSRIIKMGVATASECLQKAGIGSQQAIITGTAYGCLDDTGIFLSKMIEYKEETLTPTAFIQSTHNTVGAQIALMLQCHSYNNTFVHRGFSFENALLDAQMLLQENEAENVLVGGIDETTDISHAVLSRFGLYKSVLENNLQLFSNNTKGTIAGEGAAFFVLSNQPSNDNQAILEGMTTFYKPTENSEIRQQIELFLVNTNTELADIDLVILGRNGDMKSDQIYENLCQLVFTNNPTTNYKHLCGEYPTSTAFALWLATGPTYSAKKILIYNHYQNVHHSLFLVSKCGVL